jgi:hypothetical protein
MDVGVDEPGKHDRSATIDDAIGSDIDARGDRLDAIARHEQVAARQLPDRPIDREDARIPD